MNVMEEKIARIRREIEEKIALMELEKNKEAGGEKE